MANSYVQYSGDGSTLEYDITFPYLDQEDVYVRIDDAGRAFIWLSPTRIKLLGPAPILNSIVTIERKTGRDARKVVFTNGSLLDKLALNKANTQAFYLAQEAFEHLDKDATGEYMFTPLQYDVNTLRDTLSGVIDKEQLSSNIYSVDGNTPFTFIDGSLGINGNLLTTGSISTDALHSTSVYTLNLQSSNWPASGYKLDGTNDTFQIGGQWGGIADPGLYWDGATFNIKGTIDLIDPSSVRTQLNVEDGADATATQLDSGLDTTSGGLIVRNAINNDYAHLTSGDIDYYKWTGTEYVSYKSIKHVEAEEAYASGSTVTVPGYWFSLPIIRLFTDRTMLYDYSHPGDQSLECYASNPTLTDGVVTFDGIVQLVADANSITQTANSSISAILDGYMVNPYRFMSGVYGGDPSNCTNGTDLGTVITVPQVNTSITADRVIVTLNVSGGAGNNKILVCNPGTASGIYNTTVVMYLDVYVSGAWINSVKTIAGVGLNGNYNFDYTNTNGITAVRCRIAANGTAVYGKDYYDCLNGTGNTVYKISQIINHTNSSTVLAPGTFSYIAVEKSGT